MSIIKVIKVMKKTIMSHELVMKSNILYNAVYDNNITIIIAL